MADVIIDSFSQCLMCKHYKGKWQCDAFEIIPDKIIGNDFDHKKPFKGDNGIQFEPIEK